jgi:hypothetical protein
MTVALFDAPVRSWSQEASVTRMDVSIGEAAPEVAVRIAGNAGFRQADTPSTRMVGNALIHCHAIAEAAEELAHLLVAMEDSDLPADLAGDVLGVLGRLDVELGALLKKVGDPGRSGEARSNQAGNLANPPLYPTADRA